MSFEKKHFYTGCAGLSVYVRSLQYSLTNSCIHRIPRYFPGQIYIFLNIAPLGNYFPGRQVLLPLPTGTQWNNIFFLLQVFQSIPLPISFHIIPIHLLFCNINRLLFFLETLACLKLDSFKFKKIILENRRQG